MGTPQEAPLLSAGEPNRRRRLIYIRHFEQSSHACADPPLKRSDENIANPGPYDRIICSPYLRCRATAQLINDAWAGGERPITVDVRLAEFQGAKTRKRFKLDATSRQFGEVPPPRKPGRSVPRGWTRIWRTHARSAGRRWSSLTAWWCATRNTSYRARRRLRARPQCSVRWRIQWN